MSRVIQLISDSNPNQFFELLDWSILILGRSEQCDVALNDRYCSSQHLKLTVSADSVEAIDLDTKNGSYLNEESFNQTQLQNLDVLRIGRTNIELIEKFDVNSMRELDELANQFELQWQGPSLASIQECSANVHFATQQQALDALLDVELELRIQSTDLPDPVDYMALGQSSMDRVDRYLKFFNL